MSKTMLMNPLSFQRNNSRGDLNFTLKMKSQSQINTKSKAVRDTLMQMEVILMYF